MDTRRAETHWWRDVDDELLGCLERNGTMSPGDVARHLGMPESATVSLLCLLAQEGRIDIRLVERRPDAAERRPRVA